MAPSLRAETATPIRRAGLVALALFLGGCSSTRMNSVDTAPEPRPAAPSGTVSANALPPPASPAAVPPPATTDFPAPPQTQVAALPSQTAPAANAPDVTAGNVAGVWSASVAGQNCKVATPQTKFGQGFRAGPLHCPAPLDGVKSWNVAGKQLTLYDANGGQIASLYASGAGKFDGQTASGQPISLSR